MTIRTLQDSPALAPIARAADRVGVDVSVVGSVATRALLFDAAGAPARHLFELAEHASDIEVAHSGPGKLTRDLEAAIAEEVPMAPWLRWSITDKRGTVQRSFRQHTAYVPLRQLMLGTRPNEDGGAVDGLISRALAGDLDLVSTEVVSRTLRSLRPVDAGSVLMYVDAAIDVVYANLRAPDGSRVRPGPGHPEPAAELAAAAAMRIAASPPDVRRRSLRRLWLRLSAAGLRLDPRLFASAMRYFGLEPLFRLLDEAGYPASALVEDDAQPVLVSSPVGDGFRIPLAARHAGEGGDPAQLLRTSLATLSNAVVGSASPAPIELAAGNQTLAAVMGMRLARQPEHDLRRAAKSRGPLADDFIHVGVVVPPEAGELDASDLAAIVVGHSGRGSYLLPLHASVSVAVGRPDRASTPAAHASWRRCTIRVNLAGMSDSFETLDVFLVGGERI